MEWILQCTRLWFWLRYRTSPFISSCTFHRFNGTVFTGVPVILEGCVCYITMLMQSKSSGSVLTGNVADCRLYPELSCSIYLDFDLGTLHFSVDFISVEYMSNLMFMLAWSQMSSLPNIFRILLIFCCCFFKQWLKNLKAVLQFKYSLFGLNII